MDTTHTERLHAAAGRAGDVTELTEPALEPVTFKLGQTGGGKRAGRGVSIGMSLCSLGRFLLN